MPGSYSTPQDELRDQQRINARLTLNGAAREAFLDAGLKEEAWALVADAHASRFLSDAAGGVAVLDDEGRRTAVSLEGYVQAHRAKHPHIYGAPRAAEENPARAAAQERQRRSGVYSM